MIFVCNVAGLHVRLFRHLEGNRVSIAIHSMVLCYCICLGTVFEDASLSRNRTRPQHTTKTTHAHKQRHTKHTVELFRELGTPSPGTKERCGVLFRLHQRTVWHLIEKVLLQRPQLEVGDPRKTASLSVGDPTPRGAKMESECCRYPL